MSILKMVLAIVIAFFIIAAIIVIAIVVISYFWAQSLQQNMRETLSNPSITPSECISNPDGVLCKLELAKQKVEQLQNK